MKDKPITLAELGDLIVEQLGGHDHDGYKTLRAGREPYFKCSCGVEVSPATLEGFRRHLADCIIAAMIRP